jgi:hypothetical protein
VGLSDGGFGFRVGATEGFKVGKAEGT